MVDNVLAGEMTVHVSERCVSQSHMEVRQLINFHWEWSTMCPVYSHEVKLPTIHVFFQPSTPPQPFSP